MPRLLRSIVVMLTLAAALALTAAPSTARTIGWCKTDPIVDIGGKRANIFVYGMYGILDIVTGPTDVVINVPVGTDTKLIDTDNGFGYGYNVKFVELESLEETKRGIEIRVDVIVPATETLPIKVEITDGAEKLLERSIGETNRVVTAEARL